MAITNKKAITRKEKMQRSCKLLITSIWQRPLNRQLVAPEPSSLFQVFYSIILMIWDRPHHLGKMSWPRLSTMPCIQQWIFSSKLDLQNHYWPSSRSIPVLPASTHKHLWGTPHPTSHSASGAWCNASQQPVQLWLSDAYMSQASSLSIIHIMGDFCLHI